MKIIGLSIITVLLSGCATAVAVADGVGTVAVYTVKTTVNIIDTVTPDIINRDRK
jgi:hypothetical protein